MPPRWPCINELHSDARSLAQDRIARSANYVPYGGS